MRKKPSKEKKKESKTVKDGDKNDSEKPAAVSHLIMDATMAEPEVFDLPLPIPRFSHREYRHKRMTFGRCMKKFFVFLLSYVGLTMIVVAYSIMGGFVFVTLEAPNEQDVRLKVLAVRHKYLRDLHNVFANTNVSYRKNSTPHADADEILKKFQSEIYGLVAEEGWNGGDDAEGLDQKWTFAGGLLYAVTVITTIGYGFITPKTVPGQAITMVYALIGIPLTFLCLTNIGRFMAACFRSMYGRTLCVTCRRNCIEMFSRKDSIDSIDKMEMDEGGNPTAQNYEVDSMEEEDCEKEHDKTEVPITICLILVAWYIVFGAIMFTIWEKDWTIFQGAYFCFITLSTIGFGDIVPGFSHEDWNDQVKQVACTLYLLIGLSTLAMCFELMQHKGQSIARRCGTFCGLVSKSK